MITKKQMKLIKKAIPIIISINKKAREYFYEHGPGTMPEFELEKEFPNADSNAVAFTIDLLKVMCMQQGIPAILVSNLTLVGDNIAIETIAPAQIPEHARDAMLSNPQIQDFYLSRGHIQPLYVTKH